MEEAKPENNVLKVNPKLLNDDFSRDFDWRELKDNALLQNDELAKVYFSMRAIELVAQTVKKARMEAGMKQADLARAAQVSQAQLSRLERAADSLAKRTQDLSDNGDTSLPPSKRRIEGPTIGVVARVLEAAGYKISEIKLEKCRTRS